MKKLLKLTKITLISSFIVSLLFSNVFAAEKAIGAAAAEQQTSFELEQMLEYALQDEQLALAEYEAIIEKFDVTVPFSNIIRAEQAHEKAVLQLYEKYDLSVPTFDASSHVVLPETIEEIYDIGIQAEINNIAMYDKFLSQDLADDVRFVFERLKQGSEKHLAAFERVKKNGTDNCPLNGQGNQQNNRNKRGNQTSQHKQGIGQGKGQGLNQRQNRSVRAHQNQLNPNCPYQNPDATTSQPTL